MGVALGSNQPQPANVTRSGQKVVVGTQIGILSVFNRKKGWGDCVDRIPGHPHSVDALCRIPSRYPNAESTILTGSSDGLLRAVQILPTKLLGVVADHGEFPIERIAVDRGGEGQWVGSVGHEEILKLTDLKEVFEDDESDSHEDEEDEDENQHPVEPNQGSSSSAVKTVTTHDTSDSDSDSDDENENSPSGKEDIEKEDEGEDSEQESSDDEVEETKKRRRKNKDPFAAVKKQKGRNEIDTEPAFFADL